MEGKKIYQAITNVMKDIGAVGKDSTNGIDGYRYRGIDAVMNALSPALIKNGVVVVPQVLEMKREERVKKDGSGLIYSVVKVKYTFYAEDSSFVDTVVIGEGMDESDKSMNKAMSAAYKYACFQTFCIPTDEMIDSETDSPKAKPKVQDIRTHTANANKSADGVFERIAKSGLFKDDERFLIGSQHVINKTFGEVKGTKGFVVFLNYCATADPKFDDLKKQEQFLRCKALAAEVMDPVTKAA